MDVFVELKMIMDQFTAKMGEARAEMDATQKKAQTSFAGMGTFAVAGLATVAGAAIAAGKEAIDLADAYETSHARLSAALVANGTSFDAWKGQVKSADDAGQKLGFTNAQVEDGLARLETMVKDPVVALHDLAVAEDIARARGIDLTSASTLVGKAQEGTYTAMVRLGLVTKDQAKAFTSGAEAVNYLGNAYGGQASAYADTFAGKMQVLKATAEDLGKNLGLWLIPKVEAVASAFTAGITFIEQHKAAQVALAGVIGAIVLPMIADLVAALGEALVSAMETAYLMMLELASGAAVTGIALDDMMGPIGLVVGVLGALALSFLHSGDAAKKAGEQYATDFTDKLPQGSDKIALLGDKITQLNAVLADYEQKQKAAMAAQGAADASATAGGQTAGSMAVDYSGKIAALKGQIAGLRDEQGKLTQSQNIQNDATATADGATGQFTQSQKQLADAVKNTTQQVKDVTSATNNYYDAAVNADKAAIDWANKQADLTDKLKASKGSIDLSTQSGRDARSVVDDLAASTDQQIKAVLSSGETADQMRPKIALLVDQFDNAGRSAGLSAGDVDNLNSKFGFSPHEYNAQINVNTTAASNQLQALQNQASAAMAQTLAAVGRTSWGSAGLVPRAAGGPVEAGQPYLVGEKGRELFVPEMPGSVISSANTDAMLAGNRGLAVGARMVNYDAEAANYESKLLALHMAAAARAAAAATAAVRATTTNIPGGGSAGANAALGQQLLNQRGWGAYWPAFNSLEMREAGWNNLARNASSGAYGIPQALPESKLPYLGTAAGGSQPGAQIAWMLDYIQGRYGTPAGAWAHEVSAGWYDAGGVLNPGLTLAWNTSGRAERVTPGGLSGGDGGITVVVNVAGSVAAVDDLADAIRKSLLRKKTSVPSLGLA